jgi:hypothetical protein
VRFVFGPSGAAAAGLLDLPWTEPLAEWDDPRLIEVPQRGISRHVVRFVSEEGGLYALKEIHEPLARREYSLLRQLAELNIPAVTVLGIAVDRGPDLDAVLVTHYLDFSTSYRALFSAQRRGQPTDRLLDALVELLVRLHLTGFYWGDCSLSNTLFRHDAGTLEAYLVDAETSERHDTLSDQLREDDVTRAEERVGGELLDLEAGGLLPPDIDPIEVAEEVPRRYGRLWEELNHEEVFRPDEQRFRIRERIRRINELGFDVDELELVNTGAGNKLLLHTRLAEPGHHRRILASRTGLDVEEKQAQRLLNEIASFRAWIEQTEGKVLSEQVAAMRWRTEVYEPVVSAIPAHLLDRLAPAEVFHEVLEHRWYLSERAGRDIGTSAAANSYFSEILPAAPDAAAAAEAATAAAEAATAAAEAAAAAAEVPGS